MWDRLFSRGIAGAPLLALATTAFAVAVFVATIVTTADIAVAVLYVAVVLMAARFCLAPGIVLVALGCVCLTVSSYFLRPPGGSETEGITNTIISIAAIGVAAFLVIKGQTAELAVRRSEKELRQVFEYNPVMYFMVDSAGTVLSVNGLGAAQLGYAVDELIGQSVLKVFSDSDREPARRNLNLCLERLGQSNTWELQKIRKDGTTLWVRENAKAVVRSYGDRVVLIACEDITERKQAEDARRESEQRFRDYTETASDWFWETGPDHRFTGLSHGSPLRGAGIGATRWDLASDLDEEPEKWRVHRATLDAHEAFRGFTYRMTGTDGSTIYMSVSGKPVFDRDGRFLGYRGVATNVSDTMRANQAERALQAAQVELARVARVTSLGELAASIAHEISQPLAAILTNARAGLRWLAATPPNLSEVQDALARIASNAERAGEVIGRVRALVSKAPIRVDRLDINEAIREVIALTHSEMTRSRIRLSTSFADGTPVINGDRVQLQQVILNLILNAIQATGEGEPRELLIETRKDDNRNIVVSISDTGHGFDPANADRVFEPFYSTKSGGMGMGLSICRSIIEAHEGKIWARPNGERGSTFQFALPLAHELTATTG